MGSTLALGPQASLNWMFTRNLLSMGQKFSAASASWLKALEKSLRTRAATWIQKMFHFTRNSKTPSRGSTCWHCVWGVFLEGSAPHSHPCPQCQLMYLRGSSWVTLCWRQPGTTWTGWRISLGFAFQRWKGNITKLLSQSIWHTWRGVDTSCRF